MTKTKAVLSLILNALIIVLTIASVASFFIFGGQGNMPIVGGVCFRYFTIDSNILAAITAAVLAFFDIRYLRARQDIPAWAISLKFVGTVAVGVTFLTVMLFLGPTMGYGMMFEGFNLFMHMITPLLAIASFVLLETGTRISRSASLLGIIPTAVYGALYFVMVIVLRIWPDFYGFDRGGMRYISITAMLIGTYLLSAALRALHNAAVKD